MVFEYRLPRSCAKMQGLLLVKLLVLTFFKFTMRLFKSSLLLRVVSNSNRTFPKDWKDMTRSLVTSRR